MKDDVVRVIAEAPESVIVHNDDELYEKILEAEESIRCGRVMDFEDFDRMIREKYGI